MEIKLYKITDDVNVVHKTLGTDKTVTGTVRDSLDVYKPSILVAQDISDYNYMYIPEFGRYYFISGCVAVRTGLYQITDVLEDVLMSLKSQFLNIEAIIDKTELKSLGDEYIDDGSFITSSKMVTQIYNYSSGFNDNPDFILLTAGGVASNE